MSLPFIRQGYMPRDDDYYVILGVDFKASQETITAAYRNLARRYHPDKNTNQDERSRLEALYIFEKIQAAYDVLKDPRKRAIYDSVGPEGLKMEGWTLANKQITADDIREEFMRLQKLQKQNQINLVAMPASSITVEVNASEFFSRDKINYSGLDDDGPDEVYNDWPSLEITSMSGSMSVKNHISTNHYVSLSGNVGAKNGLGEGTLGAHYHYKYSPLTEYNALFQLGNGPYLSGGITHRLSKKTSVTAQGFMLFHSSREIYGFALTFARVIRDGLTGKVEYKEGIGSSVITSLLYNNDKLMFDIVASYKIAVSRHKATLQFGYKFNQDKSKLNVSLVAGSKEGVAVEYGCETFVSDLNLIGASVSLGVQSGVTLKLKYNRANQEFVVPVYLCDEMLSAPIFYGTMVPLVTYYIMDRYYLRHYRKAEL